MIYMREHYGHLTMQQFQMTVLSAKENVGAAASSSNPASSAAGQKRSSQTSINSFLPQQPPPAAPLAAAAAPMAVDSEDDDGIDDLLLTTADPFHVADGQFQGPPRRDGDDGATVQQLCQMHINDKIVPGGGGGGGGGGVADY
jgi:hypothetical protein